MHLSQVGTSLKILKLGPYIQTQPFPLPQYCGIRGIPNAASEAQAIR